MVLLRGQPFEARISSVLDRAPFPVWVEDDGKVVWSNRETQTAFGSDGFKGIAGLDQKSPSRASDIRVVEVAQTDGSKDHYSLLPQVADNQTVVYAMDAGPLMETEAELERFLQTLTITFAHIPIGLAVFDKKRDLTLFNPALSDLLDIAPNWLAGRPSLGAFLDRLRNNGSLPEPKDYTSLKEEFARLESGAFDGRYEVEWTLPNGRLYRVTGRPHAAGGAALLFDDITQFATVENHYRAELQQAHDTLECLTSAVAIFDSAGELSFANDAFEMMWDCTLGHSVTPVSVTELTRVLQKQARPDPAFGELRDFVLDLQNRSEWSADLVMLTGETVTMHVSPIGGGRVVCEFRRIRSTPKLHLVGTG
ncbi:MAG: PAS-domain containing protein [Pseudomonadota bacterium]